MNITEKFRFAIAEGEPLDWAMLCIELDAEHARAETTRERENLLALFTVMTDMVERIDTTADTLADFQEDRRRCYHRLLLREACLDGRLCAKTLYDVTSREVTKGRMSQDDPMRQAAITGFARLTARMDAASQGQAGVSVQLADVAGSSGGAWHRLLAGMASLARRSATMWNRTPENRTV